VIGSFRRWRFVISPPAPGADNMALDHALLRRAAATGEAVLRVYSWSTPTLSLGRHQPARGLYDPSAIRSVGVDVVRRPTGGRAVLHHREVTYSVTAPLTTDTIDRPRPRTRDIYAAINHLLVDALRALGAPVALATQVSRLGPAAAGGLLPCFDQATEGEIVAGARKLVGSAQWREGRAVLQHGSILIEDDQQLIARLAADVPISPVATLRAVLHRPVEIGEVGRALAETLDAALVRAGRAPSAAFELDADTAEATRTLRAQYADEAWTWRL
jgi:lipoate-protein ligase A